MGYLNCHSDFISHSHQQQPSFSTVYRDLSYQLIETLSIEFLPNGTNSYTLINNPINIYQFPWPVFAASVCPSPPAAASHRLWWPGSAAHSGSTATVCPSCIHAEAVSSSGYPRCAGLFGMAGLYVFQM